MKVQPDAFTPNFNESHLAGAAAETALYTYLTPVFYDVSGNEITGKNSTFKELVKAIGEEEAHCLAQYITEQALVLWSKKPDHAWVARELIDDGWHPEEEVSQVLGRRYAEVLRMGESFADAESQRRYRAWGTFQNMVSVSLEDDYAQSVFKESFLALYAKEEAHHLAKAMGLKDGENESATSGEGVAQDGTPVAGAGKRGPRV